MTQPDPSNLPAVPEPIRAALPSRTDVPDDWNALLAMARVLCNARTCPQHLRGDENSYANLMLIARSLGVPTHFAVQQFHNVDGKIGMSGQLMLALLHRFGIRYEITENSTERAAIVITRPGEKPYPEVEFTIGDAIAAGLASRNAAGQIVAASSGGKVKPWQGYTTDMLVWRAVSRACRRYAADVLNGMAYLPDELAEQAVQATAVRVDGDADVRRLALRAAAARSRGSLANVWKEAEDLNLLERETADGTLLGRLITDRAADLPAAPAAASPPEQPAAVHDATVVPDPSVPAPSAAVDAQDAEVVPDDTGDTAAAPDEGDVADADELERIEAAMAATAAAPVVADPAESRADTPRRKAVLTRLLELHDTAEQLDEVCRAGWGLGYEESSTARLGALMLAGNRVAE